MTAVDHARVAAELFELPPEGRGTSETPEPLLCECHIGVWHAAMFLGPDTGLGRRLTYVLLRAGAGQFELVVDGTNHVRLPLVDADSPPAKVAWFGSMSTELERGGIAVIWGCASEPVDEVRIEGQPEAAARLGAERAFIAIDFRPDPATLNGEAILRGLADGQPVGDLVHVPNVFT